MITPDCLSFYLLSLYPLQDKEPSPELRHRHMGKIQWVVNQVTQQHVFKNSHVEAIDSFMKHHKDVNIEQLLHNTSY